MDKNDKLIQGILAGLAGCAVKDLLTIFVELFKLHPSYWDFGTYLVFQNVHLSIGATISGIIMEILFGTALALIYAYLKHFMYTKHVLLRGFIFGLMVFFGVRSWVTLLKVKELIPASSIMMPINLLIGGLYGLTVAYVLKKLEKRT